VLALLASGLSFLRRSPSHFGQVFPAPSSPFNPFIYNLLSRRPEKVRRLLPPRDPKHFEVQKQKGSAGGNTFSTFPPSFADPAPSEGISYDIHPLGAVVALVVSACNLPDP
jgi:hypothetical protein